MTNFGDNLKNARTKEGVFQSQLLELMGIHPAHISRYERNQTVPTIDVIKKFADLLEVTTDMLVLAQVFPTYIQAFALLPQFEFD